MRIAIIALGVVAGIAFVWWLARRFADRLARRAAMRFRSRIDRYKLARRRFVRERLIADPGIAEAVREHAREHAMTEERAWQKVNGYITEIVPFFNIVAYYQVGYRVAKVLLRLFYNVTVDYEAGANARRPPRDAVLIYLMNHRSNADYIVVSYALAGQVAISYAVGEWARAFPLEHIFKAFGSYFIRRRYREPLYHMVLERYVQQITRMGVTQGIFLEGGLTRDGLLKAPKIGLLDYVLGIGRDPDYRARLFVVPVAVNYDRVLEDRSLIRELAVREGGKPIGRRRQLGEVGRYLGWNIARMVSGRWKRYGRAAVVVGDPVPLEGWFASNPDLFELAKPERLARVQQLCDGIMDRIGGLIPVTPVPLVCAAVQSLDRDFIPRQVLLDRMEEMRDALVELNGRVIRADRSIDETLEVALRMLRMRRILLEQGGGFAVSPRNRELLTYYANSIAHLLGPFRQAVTARDSLPAERFAAGVG
ncbi:MAG: 1-acyl-sn-glycerol-3-phosphate acyltransferase [Gemmatimonadaceae bacterium]